MMAERALLTAILEELRAIHVLLEQLAAKPARKKE